MTLEEKIEEIVKHKLISINNANVVSVNDGFKQELLALIKELVEEAKPGAFKFDDGQNDATHFYNKAIDEFEQNLLKALEEV